MRAFILSAVVALSSVSAFAGPSDHWTRQAADSRVGARIARSERAPYALTGDRVQRRVMVMRDVPRGRGQTESVPFWVWVSE